MYIRFSQQELSDLKNILESAFEDQANYQKYCNLEDSMSEEVLGNYYEMIERWEALHTKIIDNLELSIAASRRSI
jgi:hypothetical protein